MMTLDDNYRLSDFGIRGYQDHDHPATPNMERKTITIPGMAGEWDFGTETRSKPFRFFFKTNAINRNVLQQKMNKFIGFLFDDFGNPREIKVVFDYEPDKHYMVKLSEPITPERLMRANKYPINFIAHDPYKYLNVTSDEITWGSEIITFEYHYLLGHEGAGGTQTVNGPQTINVEVEGLAVRPIIEIEGSARSLTITNGKYRIVLPEFNNASWSIDCEKYTVVMNGKNEFGLVDLRDFYLLPGNNTVDISGTGIDIEMTIKHRDKFV